MKQIDTRKSTDSFVPPKSPAEKRMGGWKYILSPISAILVTALLLYLFKITDESMAYDEFYSFRDAKTLNPKALGVRPVYYLLLHVWMQFGTSEAWLRGLSVAFSLGSILLIYLLGRRLISEFAGLVAAALLMLAPICISNAQEVRMYMVSVFLGLAGTLTLCHALERPKHPVLGLWVPLRLLAVLTYPLNVTLVVADGILWVLRFRKQPKVIAKFVFWAALFGMIWLPFLRNLLSATNEFMQGWIEVVPAPSLRDIVGLLKVFTIQQWHPKATETSHLLGFVGKRFVQIYVVILWGLIVYGLFNLKQKPKLIWLAAWAVVPTGMMFLASQNGESLWVDRYLLFISPYFLLLLAAGFSQLWVRQRKLAIALALIYAIAVYGGLDYLYGYKQNHDWRAAIAIINSQQKAGDAILTYTNPGAFDYYYKGNNKIHEIPPDAFDISQKLTPAVAAQAFDRYTPNFESRLWIVYRYRGQSYRHEVVRNEIKQRFWIKSDWEFKDIDLFLVKPKDSHYGSGTDTAN